MNDTSLPTPLAILQPPEVIAAAAYVITKLVMDGVPVEDSLVSLDKWKGHFGMGEDMTRDREDVERESGLFLFPPAETCTREDKKEADRVRCSNASVVLSQRRCFGSPDKHRNVGNIR
jgi:hypothetical protein